MFDFLKKKNNQIVTKEEDKDDDSGVRVAAGFATAESAKQATNAAAQKFAKPPKYDRSVLDSGAAKKNAKFDAFKSQKTVKDPYTGDTLTLTKAEAKLKYGEEWTKHLAESDHKIALEQRYNETKNNQWLTNEDVKASSNSSDNLDIVSRKYNNAKRSRSNTDFVSDDEYLKKTGVELTEQGKQKAIQSEEITHQKLKKQDFKDSVRNITETGHNAGLSGAQSAGITTLTMSGILNITAVIKGEKSPEEALADTAEDTVKSAASGYVMGGGLTVLSHTLSGASSEFVRALAESNVPGKIITGVVLVGDTLKKYGEGEITTQECIIELGDKGLTFATAGYSMAVGQALIPIPIVGAAVGALVGSTLTSNYYHELVNELQTKELEHQERLRIIAECEAAARQMREYREELESYLATYFRDYQHCFDVALDEIKSSFLIGDAEGVVAGANQITRKLGGRVYYDNFDEFKSYLFDGSTDIL